MVNTEMTTTPTQQPEALRLSLLLATGWTRQKELAQAADELDRQHAENARLTAANEALRIAGVYLVLQVIDCGGCPVLAFMDEQKANEYAAERSLAYQADRRAAVIKNCGYTDAQADAFAESMASQFYVEYVEVNP